MSEVFSKNAIFGRSQSGKSQCMYRLTASATRLIWFDTVDDYKDRDPRKDWVLVRNIDQLKQVLISCYRTGFKVHYCPYGNEDFARALSDLCLELLNFQHAAKTVNVKGLEGFGRQPLDLVVDEMADSYPTQQLSRDCQGMTRMCNMGRHQAIHLHGASQRPASVSTTFRANTETFYFFSLKEPRAVEAVERMAGVMGKEVARQVQQLRPLDFIRLHDGEIAQGRITF